MLSTRARLARALAVLLVSSASFAGATAAAQDEPPEGVRVLRTGGLDLELAALLLSGQEGGPLPIAVFAAPTTPAAGGAETVVAIEVEGAALLAAPAERLHLDVCMYALQGSGPAIAASLLETVEVDLATQRERLASGGLRLVRRLQLPAGELSLRVLVRNRANRELGLRIRPLTVPSFAADNPVLSGPFFASSAGAWLDPGDRDRAAAAAPLEPPAALPVLAAAARARLQVVASAATAAGPFEVELERGEQPLVTLPATVEARTPLASGLELLTLAVDVPAVPEGVVDLRVRGGGVTLPPIRVVLATGTAELPTWAGMLAASRAARTGTDAAGAPTPAPPAPPRRDRRSERQWSTTYRRALEQLTRDQPEAGTAAVVAFESGVLAAGGDVGQELAALELEVLGELARKDAEALWPVIELYLRRHREHVAARATATAWHAQRMVFAVADLYAGSAAAPSRRLAAVAMLAFVAELPPGRERFLRTRALDAAHRYDAENVGVLLCAAIDAERFGDHEAAIRALTALRRVEAGNLEARLRLGMNHARQGSQRAARGDLRAVVDAAGAAGAAEPPWWLPLAYQELARLYVDANDLADAEKVLRQGLARLPREEKLSLLLAHVLAKRGDRQGARAVLDEVTPSPQDRGFDSARHRYMQLPVESLARAREELAQLAAAARPRLAAALARTAGSEVGR